MDHRKRVTIHDPDPDQYKRSRIQIGHPAVDKGKIGVHIHPDSEAGRFILQYEARLFQHVGSNPSVVQAFIISRCARIALHLEILDRQTLGADIPLSQHDLSHYVCFSNALVRSLLRLGIDAAKPPTPNLADLLRAPRGAPRASARALVYDSDSDGYDA